MAVAVTSAREAATNTAIRLVPAREAKSNVASWVLSPSSARITVPNTVVSSLKFILPPARPAAGEALALRSIGSSRPDDRRDDPGLCVRRPHERDRERDGERPSL